MFLYWHIWYNIFLYIKIKRRGSLKLIELTEKIVIRWKILFISKIIMKSLMFFNNLTKTIKTFPVSFLCLVVLTLLVIWDNAWWLDNFYYVEECWIATVLTFLLSLFWPLLSLHHSNWKSKKFCWINYALQFLALLIWGLYFFLLLRFDFDDAATATQMLFLWVFPLAFLGVILQISILLKVAEEDIWIAWSNIIKSVAFWVLAWLIVRWWLSWALASIEALFDVDFSYHWYVYFWAFSMILLTGLFVLNYYLISTEAAAIILPSRIRKIFGSYIILPLAMIYLAIFLAYAVKILITWEWPRWVIVRLGFWYFSLWMVCYYLTYAERTNFYEIFHRILFASFLFLVFMMWCAILKRINQYGLTINRYLVCAFIISIAVFSILSLWFQRKRLLSFIAVFFTATLISMYWWPFRASSLALYSQESRLESLAEKNNIDIPLTNNSLVNLTGEDARLVAGAIDEILEQYEIEAWSWNIIILENYTGDARRYSLRSEVHSILGLESSYPLSEDQYFSYRAPIGEEWIDVQGFSRIHNISLYKWENGKENVMILPENIWWVLDVTPYLNDIYEKSQTDYWKNEEWRTCYIIEEEWKKYVITSINWEKKSDWTIVVKWVYWYLLVK